MTVRAWWDNARERDQAAVLIHLELDPEMAGVPWVFLPDAVKKLLTCRVRINSEQLDSDWQRAEQD